ncbi:MAG: hypothetical protein KKB13_05615 [Chloroflexi bacterium]|nr:hypothetical protein [Chloroflexota bacterium]
MGTLTICDCIAPDCGETDCPLYGEDRDKRLPLTEETGDQIPCNESNRPAIVAMLKRFQERHEMLQQFGQQAAYETLTAPRRPTTPPKKWRVRLGWQVKGVVDGDRRRWR